MKKKIIILLVVGIVTSIFVTCFPTEHYLITNFEFYGMELENPNEIVSENNKFRYVKDTLKHKLFFKIEANGKVSDIVQNNIFLISQCYAIKRPTSLDNAILLNEMEVKLNSDIYFESEVIEKGTDLWNHPKLINYRWLHEHKSDDGHPTSFYAVIGFIDSFYDKVVIPQKNYTIELTCKTTDNRVITKSINLYLIMLE